MQATAQVFLVFVSRNPGRRLPVGIVKLGFEDNHPRSTSLQEIMDTCIYKDHCFCFGSCPWPSSVHNTDTALRITGGEACNHTSLNAYRVLLGAGGAGGLIGREGGTS